MAADFKVWFSSYKMLKAIGALGATVFEREILRTILTKYSKVYYRDTTNHRVEISLTSNEVATVMSKATYFRTLSALEKRGIIIQVAKKGRKASRTISVMTEPLVVAISSDKFKDPLSILESTKIKWL